MPPGRFESRAAKTALIAVAALMALAASLPALAQAPPRTDAPPPPSLPALPGAQTAPGSPLATVNSTPPGRNPSGLRPGASDQSLSYSGAANYGAPRPRVRLPRRYPPRRVGAPPPFSPRNPLPALEPYRTSAYARRALRLRPTNLADPPPQQPPPVTVAVEPTIRVKPKPRVETNPYDPLGVGIGSLRLSPYIEGGYGYDTNPNREGDSSHPKGSRLLRGDGGFALKSDWARHDFQANLRFGYSEYFDNHDASRPDGAGDFVARYDVMRDTAIDVLGRFSLDTQRPGAPAISSGLPNVTVTNRPIIFASGGAAGVTQKFNRLSLSLRGTVERDIYQNAYYSDGSTLDLARTNYTGYGAQGRAVYELTPNVSPFVEASIDKRVHDAPSDPYGYYRDSHGMAARGGAVLKFSELLRGEASGGYAERAYDDPRLARLRGPTIDAALIYTPTPLTTMTLRGTTGLNETTLAGASGVLTHAITAQVSHDLMRNLRVTVLGSYYTNDYQGATVTTNGVQSAAGAERGYTAGVKLEYKITRSISIKGSFSHEHLNSPFQGADYTTNVYLVGLRLQL